MTAPDATQVAAPDGVVPAVRLVHVGASEHGVTRFGLDLAASLRDRHDVRVADELHVRPGIPLHDLHRRAIADRSGGPAITHLQFADGLWGGRADAAASAWLATVAGVRDPVVVTLHDVPDPEDDAARFARRAAAYAAVAHRADRVVVSSAHEAARLRRALADPAAGRAGGRRPVAAARVGSRRSGVVPAVIPNPMPTVVLPVPWPAAGADIAAERRAQVGVLGWIFPGKGHDDVLDELDGRTDLAVAALGRPAAGHDRFAASLSVRAAVAGVDFTVSGWLPPGDQTRRILAVDVPVAPHPRPSASGSMLAWIAAGRRPLVRRSAYAEELAARAPQALRLYDRGGLAAAVDAALADPVSTWLHPADRPAELGAGTAAARHVALYRELASATGGRRSVSGDRAQVGR